MDLNKYRDIKVNTIGESGDESSYVLSAYGTSFNCSDTGAGTASMIYNKTVQDWSFATRGIQLVVIDHANRTELHRQVYDVYGSTVARDNLAIMLNEIHVGAYGQAIYLMSSYDAIGTNANLADAMTTARAHHWFNVDTSNGPTHRHPYAAIGTSRLGIIKEVVHGNTSGVAPSIVTMHVPEDWNAIGSEGYGPDLALGQQLQEFEYTGTGYSFNHGPHLTVQDTGAYHIQDGEWVRMTGQQKISLDRQESGGYVRSYMWSASTTDGWIRATANSGYSTEWQNFELYFRWDQAADTASGSNTGNGSAIYLRFGHYHYPSTYDVGTSYVRNVQLQKCGFDPNRNRSITFKGVDDLDGRNLIESAGPFSLSNPDNYWTVWNSSRNLTGRPNLGDSYTGSGFDTNNVRWFNRTLTNRNEYSIHEGKNWGAGDSNRYNDIGAVDIDPDKMYLGCIWHWCEEKISGYNYLGCHTYNSSGATTNTQAYNGTYNSTNPYSMYPAASDIEKQKWSLWSYWFLPQWMTNTEGTDFYNNYWSKWAGNYENASADNNQKTAGAASSNGGNCRIVKFTSNDAKIHLRWLDFYNSSGHNHKTWWALPMIIEVDPLNFGANGAIDFWNLTEDSTYAATQVTLPKGIA